MLRQSPCQSNNLLFCHRKRRGSNFGFLRLRALPRIQLSESLTAVSGSVKSGTDTEIADRVFPSFKH